ncbi:MAG: DsbA family protein [Patescibacteria group bacterium]|jgi:protein-disulfide isomerase
MNDIPPLESTPKPLYFHWWFLTLIFAVVLVAGSFSILLYKYIKGIQTGEVTVERGFTQDPGAATTGITYADVVTDDDPSLGTKDAKVTIVQFADFQCPYCQEAFPIIRELTSKYQDQVHFIIRDFPLIDIHPDAESAAIAASCVAAQSIDKFWSYHDQLYINQSDLSPGALRRYAQNVGAQLEAFDRCITDESVLAEINADYAAGVEAGVVGTPTFFINGQKVEGVIPRDIFEQVIISESEQQGT